MLDLGQDSGFTLEAAQALRVDAGAEQELERQAPAVAGVTDLVDHPHAAPAELRQDLVGTDLRRLHASSTHPATG